jgi:hypothetical protein
MTSSRAKPDSGEWQVSSVAAAASMKALPTACAFLLCLVLYQHDASSRYTTVMLSSGRCKSVPPLRLGAALLNKHLTGSLFMLLVCRCRTHPHRDAEIFSYVLEGQLTHQDSMGNRESLSRGAVQYLSAGSGITHSVSAGSWHFGRQVLGPPCLRYTMASSSMLHAAPCCTGTAALQEVDGGRCLVSLPHGDYHLHCPPIHGTIHHN